MAGFAEPTIRVGVGAGVDGGVIIIIIFYEEYIRPTFWAPSEEVPAKGIASDYKDII